jgi:hypothetical protein
MGGGLGGVKGDASPGLGASAGIFVPHLMQNFVVSRASAEQLGHFLVIVIPYYF